MKKHILHRWIVGAVLACACLSGIAAIPTNLRIAAALNPDNTIDTAFRLGNKTAGTLSCNWSGFPALTGQTTGTPFSSSYRAKLSGTLASSSTCSVETISGDNAATEGWAIVGDNLVHPGSQTGSGTLRVHCEQGAVNANCTTVSWAYAAPPATDTTAPTRPVVASVVAVAPGQGRVTLTPSVDEASGIAGYIYFWGNTTAATGNSSALTAPYEPATYVITGTPGQAIYIQARGVDGAGNQSNRSTPVFGPFTLPPNTPTPDLPNNDNPYELFLQNGDLKGRGANENNLFSADAWFALNGGGTFTVPAEDPHATISTTHARIGTYSIKGVVDSAYLPGVVSKVRQRTEVAVWGSNQPSLVTFGEEVWYGWSMWLGEAGSPGGTWGDFRDTNQQQSGYEITTQWHAPEVPGRIAGPWNPPIDMRVEGPATKETWFVYFRYMTDPLNPATSPIAFRTKTIAASIQPYVGRWIDFVVRARYQCRDSQPTGYWQLWIKDADDPTFDAAPIVDDTGKNNYCGGVNGTGQPEAVSYWKAGDYTGMAALAAVPSSHVLHKFWVGHFAMKKGANHLYDVTPAPGGH